jgi:glutathione S-transferase
MVMKLHGSPFSTCTQRVLTVLAEKGVTDFEIVTVNLPAGAHKREPHISMQPFGRIPALEDDGFVVYESRAICRYIAAKYAEQGNQVMPNGSDLKALAIFEQVSSKDLSYLRDPNRPLLTTTRDVQSS